MGAGSSQSVTQESHVLTAFMAQSMVSSKQICQSSLNAQQIINISCQYTAAELDAKANSVGCRLCLEKNSAKDCEQYCTIPCNVSNVTQNAVYSFSTNCQLDASAAQALQADIMNDIQNEMTTKQDGLSQFLNAIVPGSSETVAQSLDIKNQVSSIFSVSNVNQMLTQLSTIQQINISSGNVNGVHQDVAVSVIQSAIESSTAGQQLVAKADTLQKLTQSTTQQTPITDLVDSIGNLWNELGMIGPIVLGIVALGAIYFVLKPFVSSSDGQPPPIVQLAAQAQQQQGGSQGMRGGGRGMGGMAGTAMTAAKMGLI